MVALLLVLGTLAFQASASTVPVGQRRGGLREYAGPGSFVKDLTPRSDESAGIILARSLDYDRATELLGPYSVVDCHPNGRTSSHESLDAYTSFVNRMGGRSMTIQPNLCHHVQAGSTLAQICNQSDQPTDVTPETVQTAFDILADRCTNKEASGTIRTANGLQFALYAKVGVGSQNARRRSSGKLAKRCLPKDTTEVTGCEDIVCDPNIRMNGSGDCPNVGNDATDGCSYYCEVKAAKYYGVPTIWDDTRYCNGQDCYIETEVSFTVEKSLSTSFGLEGAGPLGSVLSAGVGFGIALSKTQGKTQGYQFGEGKCGWWYLAPVMVHTCGSLSEYKPNFTGSEGGPLYCLKDAPLRKTTGNVCAEIQAAVINGDEPEALIIPKYYECGPRKELPMDQQSQPWKDTYGGDLNKVHTC